jgi:hypothetical protein
MAFLLILSSVIAISSAKIPGSVENYVLMDSFSILKKPPRIRVTIYKTPSINVVASQNCNLHNLETATVLDKMGSTLVPTPPSVVYFTLALKELEALNSVPISSILTLT